MTLVVDGVSVAYGDLLVLDNVSLEVGAGETIAVIGPSGSGKSTLLRAIAGLEPLVGGRITLNGLDLAGIAPHRRGLGLMFQDHALFPHLTVADNIAYGLERAHLEPSVRRERVAEMLKLVGLDGFGARSIDQLSGGEAQRVALARALAPSPGLLMLDEPLGSLDRVLREQLVGDLNRLLREVGQTALHVTHDQAEAFALADRVVVLSEGTVVADGTPQALWSDPRTIFVAEFLGRPNIWTLEPAGAGAVRWVEAGIALPSVGDPPTGPVVVPVEAIGVIPTEGGGPGLNAILVDARFREGRYRYSARPVDGTADEVLMFDDVEHRAVGDTVTLRIDLREAVALVAERGSAP